jgi:spore maturation protein CgeB
MKILYIAANEFNAKLQGDALRRLGHDVFQVDPYGPLKESRLGQIWTFKTGNFGTAWVINNCILQRLQGRRFDVCLVDGGDLVSAALVQRLRSMCNRVVLFCRDNPFVARDGLRWRLLKSALPHYDLFVTRRQSSVEAAYRLGAKNAMHVFLPADEVAHRTPQLTAADRERYGAPVSFIGTWMPERGPFIERLLQRGVPLRVIGPRWTRAENYRAIRSVASAELLNTTEYVKALAACQIALAMLSKGNADLHTARSVEIPAIGRLLCAERTEEHQAMYRDGEEAVFWNDADECADVCLALLSDPDRIERIAAAGHRRILANGHFNEPTFTKILTAAMGLPIMRAEAAAMAQ